MHGSCKSHPHFYYFLAIGRVFLPFLTCPVWSGVRTLDGLSLVRLVMVGMFAFTAFLLCQWLRKNSISTIQSILVSVTIFLLPPFQSLLLLVSYSAFPLGLMASLFAGLMGWEGAQRVTGDWKSLLNRYSFLAIALLFFSMGCYTPLSTFYFAVIAAPLIQAFPSEGLRIRKQLYLFGVFFAAAAAYALFSKMTYAIVPSMVQIPKDVLGAHHIEVVKNLRAKVPIFSTSVFLGLSLWEIPPSKGLSLAMAAILLLGVAVRLLNSFRKEGTTLFRRPGTILGGFFIALLFPLAMLPHLAAEFYLLSYRMIGTLYALIVITLFFAIREIALTFFGKIGNFVISSVLLVSALLGVQKSQASVRNYIVVPSQTELRYIKGALEKKDLVSVQNIYVMRPPVGNFLGATRYVPTCDDEFGLMTSTFPQNITGLIRLVLREMGVGERELERIKISTGFEDKVELRRDPQTIVIDMNQVYRELYSKAVQ